MKQVFVVAGLAGAALANISQIKQANSFLRSRRAIGDDDVFNYREEWENFKDVLEATKQSEAEVDALESCVAECRSEDWAWGAGFSESREKYDEHVTLRTKEKKAITMEKPIPCKACCDKIPKFVGEGAKAGTPLEKFNKVFGTCIAPSCQAGQFANAAQGTCADCAAGTFTEDSGNTECSKCNTGQTSTAGAVECHVCEAGTYADKAGSPQCTPCPEGSSSEEGQATCTENVCSCDNGVAATGAKCTANGATVCDSCSAGYHAQSGACEENRCQCQDGGPATGADCPTHGDFKCTSCNDNSVLEGTDCVATTTTTTTQAPTTQAPTTATTTTQAPTTADLGAAEGARPETTTEEATNGDGKHRTVPESGGRMEVFHDGEWGTICNDEFDDKDAEVACRAMGKSGGRVLGNRHSLVTSGAKSSKIWLDNVRCVGNENSLFDCPRGPANKAVGKHNCGHSEDIGVQCN